MSVQQELISRQHEQIMLLERELSVQQQQFIQLTEQVKTLQERLAKDSHNSHLPPSSDRFGRTTEEAAQEKWQEARGQVGHPGHTCTVLAVP